MMALRDVINWPVFFAKKSFRDALTDAAPSVTALHLLYIETTNSSIVWQADSAKAYGANSLTTCNIHNAYGNATNEFQVCQAVPFPVLIK